MSNILFTTLSTAYNLNINYYNMSDSWCSGIQQQEPGAKYILSIDGIGIDKIVILGSKETLAVANYSKRMSIDKQLMDEYKLTSTKLSEWKECPNLGSDEEKAKQISNLSAYRKLLMRLADYVFESADNIPDSFVKQFEIQTMKKRDTNTERFEQATERFAERTEKMKAYTGSGVCSDIEVVFVPDKDESGMDNVKELIAQLCGTQDNPSNIYMDMQGGARTAIYVNNAVLQMLGQADVYHTKLQKVVATNFDPSIYEHPIIDETKRYKIVELVAGMNAFLRYGKADALSDYIESLNSNNPQVHALVNAMQEIDTAISLSRIEADSDESTPDFGQVNLPAAISNLKLAINGLRSEELSDDELKNLFDILIVAIQKDYGNLLEGDTVNVIALIEWLIQKENWIVAATVAETLLPEYIVSNGFLYYAKSEEELKTARDYFLYYCLTNERFSYQFRDINHYFIKNYLPCCSLYFTNAPKLIEKKVESGENILPAEEKAKHISTSLDDPTINPIPLYSDYPDRIGMILVLYGFVSQNRNCFAHPKESFVSISVFKKALTDLIDELRLTQAQQNRNVCCLPSDEIKKLKDSLSEEKKEAKEKELWLKIIQKEINTWGEFGSLRHHVQSKTSLNSVTNAYALGGTLYSLRCLYFIRKKQSSMDTYRKNGTFSDLEKLKFVRDPANRCFIELCLKYYNAHVSDIQKLTYDQLTKMELKPRNVSEVTTKTVLERIISNLSSYDSFAKLVPYLQDEESWRCYLETCRETYQSERNNRANELEVDPMIQKLDSFFCCIKSFDRNSNWIRLAKWKDVIRYNIENEPLEETIRLLTSAKSETCKKGMIENGKHTCPV